MEIETYGTGSTNENQAVRGDRKRRSLSVWLAVVRRTQPDGITVIDEIPLTRDDLLYPEEGDFVVQEPWHAQDFTYCYSALAA